MAVGASLWCNAARARILLLVVALLHMTRCDPITPTDCTGGTVPSVFVWAHPRVGSSLFLNSLASSGHWGENSYLETFNLHGVSRYFGMAPQDFGFEHVHTNFTELVDTVRSRGPFVWKEMVYILLNGGAFDRHSFLRDPNIKHIFLIRDPRLSLRSYAVSFVKHQNWFEKLETVPGLKEALFGFRRVNPYSWASIMRLWGSVEPIYLLYRYMTDVLHAHDNLLVVDIEDVFADPRTAMQQIAEFAGVPWTEQFLHWNGAAFKVPEVAKPWYHTVATSRGFLNRKEKNEGTTTEADLGLLPAELEKAMQAEIEFSAPLYDWLNEHVPQSSRLRKNSSV
eukprot:m.42148 g.42148  ORF g.42148 m.42148 type:complete len:338 (+) comp46377_c0_seq1:2-1015(+)